MSSTTINPGLEIRHLSFKDDSFRQADWYDNTTGNQITFSNGTVTTNGATGITPSPVLTNGDELTLPSGYTIEKRFGTEATVLVIPFNAIQAINVRVKLIGSPAE